MLKSCLFHNLIEAGCDEAGRGCLAGPVVAAAVILPKNYKHPILNDSKKLTAAQRELLRIEIIKGDGLFFSIAAASVLAKTFRDEFMEKIHNEYPGYGWDKNKGYATQIHRDAIIKYGITPYHRRSFTLLDT